MNRNYTTRDCPVCGGAGFLATEAPPNVCIYCKGSGHFSMTSRAAHQEMPVPRKAKSHRDRNKKRRRRF